MQIPSVAVIEEAADSISCLDDFVREDQFKELWVFGEARARQLGASGISVDFKLGYELGLQTARMLLAQNPKADKMGVDI